MKTIAIGFLILILGMTGSAAGEEDRRDEHKPDQRDLLTDATGALPPLEVVGGEEVWRVRPYAIVVGGVQHEAVWNQKGYTGNEPIVDGRGDRFVTMALSRFGLLADYGEHVEVQSEIEVNMGAYGTSVWEGQAALQVNNQLLRLSRWGGSLSLGRITDPSSVDFVSEHLTDQLLMDFYTRTPMLESGYNRGNGILLDYEIIDGLQAAVTFNSATPLSTTGGYLIAGKYSNGKFSRWYRLAGEQILSSPNRYPSDNTHLTVLTPSVRFRHPWVEAHASVQLLWANVDVNKTNDKPIFGTNFRAGARGCILDGLVEPFFNFSWLEHNLHNYQAEDQEQRTQTWEGQGWHTMTITAGLDFNYWDRNGVGVQYSHISAWQGDGSLIDGREHFISVGTTFWITDTVAVGGRVSFWMQELEDQAYVGSEWVDKRVEEGERSIYFTLRKVL